MANAGSSEIVQHTDKGPVLGKYIVEIADAETGQVKRTYESDNYVTPLHTEQVLALQSQAAGWSSPPFEPAGGLSARLLFNKRYVLNPIAGVGFVPRFLICTDWTDAEDTSDSWLRGDVVACGFRSKVSTLSGGKAGTLNYDESGFSNDGRVITWVWDWSTAQGNGTYQTIALGALGNESDETPAVAIGVGNRGYSMQMDDLTVAGQRVHFVSDGTTMYFAIVGSTPSPYCWWRDITSKITTPDRLDGSGLWGQINSPADMDTWTQPAGVAPFVNSTSGNTNSSYYFSNSCYDFAHDGTNMYLVQFTNSGTIRIRKWALSDGTEVYNNGSPGITRLGAGVTETTGATKCTYLGGKLYAFFYYGPSTAGGVNELTDRRRIARIDATTGNFEAWVDLDSTLEDNVAIVGLTNNGTDLIVECTDGVRRYTTGGLKVAESNIGMFRLVWGSISDPIQPPGTSAQAVSSSQMKQAVAPDNTSYYYRAGATFTTGEGLFMVRGGGPSVNDDWWYSTNAANASSTIESVVQSTTNIWLDYDQTSLGGTYQHQVQVKMVWHNSRLWVFAPGSAYQDKVEGWDLTYSYGKLLSVDGYNCFSRTLLDSPVTKGATETMKITYQLTLPADPYRTAALTHDAPW